MATKKTTTRKKAGAKTSIKDTKIAGVALLDDGQKPKDKFAFLYVLFACTTLIFAAVSVYLFWFASSIQSKYDEIEACYRTPGASCEVRIKDSGDGDQSDVDILPEENKE